MCFVMLGLHKQILLNVRVLLLEFALKGNSHCSRSPLDHRYLQALIPTFTSMHESSAQMSLKSRSLPVLSWWKMFIMHVVPLFTDSRGQ